MEYSYNPNIVDPKVKEIQSMLNRALDNAVLLLKADSSLPSLLGDPHYFQTLNPNGLDNAALLLKADLSLPSLLDPRYFQTLPHNNYIPNGWGKISEDGRFGNDTVKAVKSFQEFMRISVDGIVGKDTYPKLCTLASINECPIQIMGHPLQTGSKTTRNDDKELLNRFIQSIKVSGENLCKQLIDFSINFLQNMIGNMSVNWIVDQMRNRCLVSMDNIKAQSFLDLLKTRNASKMYQSKGVVTNSLREAVSSKSIRIEWNNAEKSVKINKAGNAGGLFVAVILAFSKVIAMILNYQDSEEWEKTCKNECCKAIESVLCGSIASVILKNIIFAITGGTTTTFMIRGATIGASGGGPGVAMGALGGILIGGSAGIAIVYVSYNIIMFLVECLFVTLISFCLSSLFKFIAEVAGIKDPFKKYIFEPIFDSMMIPLKRNFNDNR